MFYPSKCIQSSSTVNSLIVDPEAREIMHLVYSIRPSVSPFVFLSAHSQLNQGFVCVSNQGA